MDTDYQGRARGRALKNSHWHGGFGAIRYALLLSMQFAPYNNIAIQPNRLSSVPGSLPESFAKSFARLCAREIFSAFMLQLATTMAAISGHLERRAHIQKDNSEPTLRWKHGALSKLTNIVRDSKLAVDDEAYMLVYRAFEACRLLPED